MSRNFSDFQYQQNPSQADMQRQAKQSYEQLKDLDQEGLIQKLNEEVQKQKSENRFNYSLLLSTIESMRSFLPPETYMGLKDLLEKIK